uniref:Uncharacterized protein n=1 Tax=Lepeophtheirus salmonis TaxID=72036 RepID=A0A0K2TPH7_LEPSM
MYKPLLSVAIACVFVAHQAVSQSESAYQFPADAEAYLDAPLSTTFTCDGQPYGYYADVDNNCKVSFFCRATIAWEMGMTSF